MSYQEKERVASSLSGIVITLIYTWIIYRSKIVPRPGIVEDFSFWGKIVLIFIGVSIGARTILLIIFNIIYMISTRGEDGPPAFKDERDKLIELKSVRNSLVVFTIGFVTAMVLLAAGLPGYSMFPVLMAGGLLSEIAGDISAVRYYRRGM